MNGRADIDYLAEKLRGTADELDRVLLQLTVEGALSLEDRQYFEEQIVEGVSAAFCFMRVDDRRLFPARQPKTSTGSIAAGSSGRLPKN
ncbi:MAG: hypothetical protein U5K33_07015 [Halofilum sp. (in: g-proteobacteria)]|nr:hypothetical protein [Halofilum sp. (in: g-proteobacteria)]